MFIKHAMRLFFVSLMGIVISEGMIGQSSASIVTQWDFNNLSSTPNNSPAPSIGTGTATSLGMGTPDCDITNADGPPSDDTINWWRVRGGGDHANGWWSGADQYTQGAEFDVDTTGSTGIQFQFDWFCTTKGVADMQPQYTIDGSTWINKGSLITSTTGNTWKNQVILDFSSISGVNNDPNFGVRLVSAWKSGTSAYEIPGGTPMEDGKGNWRFDMVTILNDVVITPGVNVTWATTNGTWNTTGSNWTGGNPNPNKYKDTDNAIFSDISANSTVTVDAAGVAPNSTNIKNAANTYTFTGGSINAGSLTKSSAGTAILSASNGYNGGTTINGGTLIVDGGDNRLGFATSMLTIDGGTLQTNTSGLASSRAITVGTSGGTFKTNGFDSSTSGHTSVNGTITKADSGNLALNGGVSFGSSGSLTINSEGSVTFGHTDDQITMSHGGTFNGNLILDMDSSDPNHPPRLNFDGTVPYSGSGEVQVQKSGIVISNNNSNSYLDPIYVDVKIHLNSLNNAFTKSDVTQEDPLDVAHPFVTTIGGTRDASQSPLTVPNNLHISQKISGNSDVNVANQPTGTGSGNLWLEAQNDYTGATMINGDHDATVYIGVNNALPITTDVIFGTGSAVMDTCNPKIDLNGHNQQINSLSHGQYATAMAGFGITNYGAADSILKVSGSTTPYNSFGGVISDGTSHKISLEKAGTGKLTLSNVNTYTGATTIHDGILELAELRDPDFGTLISTGQISIDSVITTDSTGTFQIKNGTHTVGVITGTGTTNLLSDSYLTVATSITQNSLTMGSGAGVTITGGTNSLGTITGSGAINLLNGELMANSIILNHLSIGSGAKVIIRASAEGPLGIDSEFQAVPEPSTFLLIVTAAIAGGVLLWKKRQQ